MLINRKGFATLVGTALLIATSNANALLFWSDHQNGATITANYIGTFHDHDDNPVTPDIEVTSRREIQGAYGIGGTDYANGISFTNSGITMNITTNSQTPELLDQRYLGNSHNVNDANALLTSSSNGLIAGHGTSVSNLIATSVGASMMPNPYATSIDPYDISTSFDISFSHDVILNAVQFDRISKGGTDETSANFNIAPTFDITGGSNNLNILGLITLTKNEDDGESTIIPGGALFLAGQLYTIDIHAAAAVIGTGAALNSIAEFQAWDVTPVVVPLPAALWFLLSGLIALFGINRKKQPS